MWTRRWPRFSSSNTTAATLHRFQLSFREAAVLSIDGSGDFTTTMMARGKGTDIEVLDSLTSGEPALLYRFHTIPWLPHYGDEYKVMGLAPYGTLVSRSRWPRSSRLRRGWYRFPMKDYLDGWVVSYPDNLQAPLFGPARRVFGPTRKKGEPLTRAYGPRRPSSAIARSFHLLRRLPRRDRTASGCIAGGVAQNSVANGKITRNRPSRRSTSFRPVMMRASGWVLPNTTFMRFRPAARAFSEALSYGLPIQQ